MPAVSDSSPLILYARIRRLDLLRDVYGGIIVPPAVWREIVADGLGRPGADEIQWAQWIRVQPLGEQGLERAHQLNVGPGEAEAIALAMQLTPKFTIVLDDSKARRIAREYGLVVTGSAGILALAKELGLVPAVRPVLDDLLSAGLYLSQTKTYELLETVGE